MGCSASRLDTLIAKAIEDPSTSSSSSSSLSSSKNSSLCIDSSSTSSSNSSSMAPKTRSLSTPLVHHPALVKGDTHHLVCLTSSTYGSLIIDNNNNNNNNIININEKNDSLCDEDDGFSVINTWELMEGLEDEQNNDDLKSKSSTFCDFKKTQKNSAAKLDEFKENLSNSCDFNGAQKMVDSKLGLCLSDSYVFVEMPEKIAKEVVVVVNSSSSKPLWKHLSEESLISKMDPSVGNAYDRALLPKKLDNKSVGSSSIVPKSKSVNSVVPKLSTEEEYKIVLYYTSLRGIRKTYEDCSSVRMILRGYCVVVDERDISMDSSYRFELQRALVGNAVTLPQLFIKGECIGGADVVRRMNETGELARILEGFPTMDGGFVCRVCGDARFVPCSCCNGSRKVFWKEEGRMKRCTVCNENGLVRCPGCCCSS